MPGLDIFSRHNATVTTIDGIPIPVYVEYESDPRVGLLGRIKVDETHVIGTAGIKKQKAANSPQAAA